MKKYWGYVDSFGYIAIKLFIVNQALTDALFTPNIRLVITPFPADDYVHAHQIAKKILEKAV